MSIRTLALAGVSVLSIAGPAFAQASDTRGADGAGAAASGEEIVVQARRRSESAQDVPLVVNAVTADTIAKLNIREFQDIQSVVPGLSLGVSPNGIGVQAALRGVAYDVNASGNNGTIEFYQNDHPLSAGILFQSMFDVGQIEVLRGPQGTLRGRASPSGSITVTTRRPDLDDIGGYAMMTGNTLDGVNVNGAVGVPIIRDVLAIRVAGVYESGDGNQTKGLNNRINPYVNTWGARVSLRFEPTSSLTFDASYTKTVRDARQFDQVESANIADPALPASLVTIRATDRLASEATPRTFRQAFQVWSWRGEFRFAGQKLNYVGSYNKQKYDSLDPNDKGFFFDTLYNGIAAVQGAGQSNDTAGDQETHELRLSSDERLFGMADYVVGGLINKSATTSALLTRTLLFNPPAVVVPAAALTPTPIGGVFVNTTPVFRPSNTMEKSLFANVNLHLGEATELSGGLRYIHYKDVAALFLSGAEVLAARRTGVPAEEEVIYSASLKHRFSPNLMAYASFGTSWRPGSNTNAIIDRSNVNKSARLQQFLFPGAEKSKSYEIGIKSDWFDRRLTANITAYHQDFENYAYSSPRVFSASTDNLGNRGVGVFDPAFAVGVPAKVDGVEAELAWNSGPFRASASLNYSISKIKNGVIPCNDFFLANGAVGRDNIPDSRVPTVAEILQANGGEIISTCTVNYRAGNLPPFSGVVQAEYDIPISSRVDGYIRGLASFYGKSQNDPANRIDDVAAYMLGNLYAGIRDPDGAWEVSLYAKNIFDVERTLTRNPSAYSVSYQNFALGAARAQNPATGYRGITMTAPREFGLTVRYAFGSR